MSLPSGPRHAVLNSFAYGIVVFVVRDIGVYRVSLTHTHSRPLKGSRVKKVSTKCRLRVDHVYSGTLISGTLILVPFSCHKTGTSSIGVYRVSLERFCKTKMCTNFRSTSRSEKLRTNFRNFGRETCREREMNFRRKFREIGSCRTCTWRVQTTKMCRTQSSCENSYTLSQGLSRNFVRTFVVQNLSIGTKQTVEGVTCQKSINNVSTTCRPSV